MKIEITCDEKASFAMTLEIHKLDFDPKSKEFSMRVVMGDDWLGQCVCCPVELIPSIVSLEAGIGRIHFASYKDAAAFGEWLIDSDERVQYGFRTMQG